MNKLIAIFVITIYLLVIYKKYSDSKEGFSNYSLNELNKCTNNYVILNKSYNKVLDSLYKEREIHYSKCFASVREYFHSFFSSLFFIYILF